MASISRRVAPPVCRVGIGKQLADVAQAGGPQQGIGHGVQQHVGVAVANGRAIVGDIDAAQSQRSTGRQPMRIVSDSNPCSLRDLGS